MIKRWGIPALLGLLILTAIGFWGYKEYQDRIVLENYLNNRYQMSFYNLINRVQNMEVLLGKTLAVSGDTDNTLIFSEIWLQAEGARENLTQLPLTSSMVGRTAKFLAQSGDFARVQANKITSGQILTEEEYSTLNSLYRQAAQLNKDLQGMEAKVADGRLTVSEIVQSARQDLAKGTPTGAAKNFQGIDQQMQGFPTLIYDGPFSDHLDRVTPVGLGNEDISADEARTIARRFIDIKDDESYRAQISGRTKEKIPGYLVELIPRNGEARRIVGNVSNKGGKMVWYMDSRDIGAPKLTTDQAREKALQFLEAKGYKNVTNIYHQLQDNRAIFNFIPQQQGVVIYPDQIKVSVALDNGQVIGFDARGYLMAHKKRDIPAPQISANEAKKKVNKRMEITETKLAIIPTDGGKERFSYEITGNIDGETYLVYVNAITGKTDKVLKLIEQENGILTM
ncbi:Propeptide, PepSY amd peptidase M4 [Desulforamulus reducens MI-1]|uniref:Propeptide, PepSY amd peptidase M4 n=1 Tax=Desulforamulus reducens (strain ATCC BAA-1160 / DSM 100696 / MI-1) TaxID=349161 RepID=A4J9E3_DESRM|nr:germination protein YpeB [Desulforamulus reducens]ABO51696.1 Propeptide, PepSY amd peptidase M4 [Desulforamulus reducens MI-1]